MIPVSAAQLKAQIIPELGDEETEAFPSGVLTGNLDVIWDQFADKGLVDVRLQYLYAKSRAIDYLKGAVRKKISRRTMDQQASFSDEFRHLKEMQEEVRIEIAVFEESTANSYPDPQRIAQVAPVVVGDYTYPYDPIDANNPILRGDPYLDIIPPR